MPKPPNLIPSKQLNVALPLPEFTQLMLHLNSDLEGRVPHGAYSRFLTDLLREYFSREQVDLGPFISPDIPAGLYIVSGSPETIGALKRILP